MERIREVVYPDMESEDVKNKFEGCHGPTRLPRTILKLKDDKAWKPKLWSELLNIDQVKKCRKFDGESHYSDIDQLVPITTNAPKCERNGRHRRFAIMHISQ